MRFSDSPPYELYVLTMSPLISDISSDIAIFYDLTNLSNFYNEQLADTPYQDNDEYDMQGNEVTVTKHFKKGSFLERYKIIPQISGEKKIDHTFTPIKSEQKEGYRKVLLQHFPRQDNLTLPLEPPAFREAVEQLEQSEDDEYIF